MNRGFFVALGIALSTSGCGDREVDPKNIEPRPEPVVVYADYEDKSYLPTLFADFTHETGIRVTVKTATPDIIVSNVIEDRGSPPADLILTPTVIGVWRAADEGALLPLRSELVKETVPESFRDPDGYWVAVGFQTALIVLSTNEGLADGVTHYEDLAKPEFKGKLCLSSSTLPENRSLIAMLIGKHGVVTHRRSIAVEFDSVQAVVVNVVVFDQGVGVTHLNVDALSVVSEDRVPAERRVSISRIRP